ncbi:hypothetical protein B0T25DRAFT_337916 [Lasiosphaeria hispida]|uniref:Deubiquitination-protection protein dph1 n=1 Tax=Lasiosphaeria hispida TaxID=260671 RepID=A0AAJ0H616_9PEZI|nr:hypothetical protein B0T25DRAFT_337916 [Lasiosphaeria hispida]
MADSSETATEAPQITFKVKSSSDKTHTITMTESATVLELKTMLAGADFEDVPVERQRLIYSGRVMKNDDDLSVYKIKNLNTIHMVKSAASNPTPAPAASTPQAVPQNMAAGASANNLLAALTGARFAGHANLPSRDIFGADGGMGAPPTEDQVAEMLSNPAIAQTMNEALNNPAFVDRMIQSNPMLARIPNAREMLQSPYFRNMMTNPEAIRMAARMRRMMGGQGGGGAFPAPGVTDTTPGAPGSEGAPAGDGNGAAQNSFLIPGLFNPFGSPGAGAGPDAAGAAAGNPFAALLGQNPFGIPPPGATGAATGTPTSPTQASTTRDGENAPAQAGNTAAQQAQNPFAALFGAAPGQGGQGGGAANPFGLPNVSPEALQQMMQMLGGGMGSPAAAAPADTRPPEERYAEQLRQLNDMGFFDFDRNIAALRRSGGSVQGAIEHLLNG